MTRPVAVLFTMSPVTTSAEPLSIVSVMPLGMVRFATVTEVALPFPIVTLAPNTTLASGVGTEPPQMSGLLQSPAVVLVVVEEVKFRTKGFISL